MICAPKDKTINYIEFKVLDMVATKKFYQDCLGWTYTDYGPDYAEFSDGHMHGGFEIGTPQPGGALIVLYSKDLVALQKSIEDANGTITKALFEFPGGRRFHFKDLNGYELAAWSE